MTENEHSAAGSPLGKTTPWPQTYDPSVLYPIPREPLWRAQGHERAPFVGEDLWTAWELSWLTAGGLPRIAVARLRVPADSPFLVESKSLKLYLGSFAETVFPDAGSVRDRIASDLAGAAGGAVGVELVAPTAESVPLLAPAATCVDDASEVADLDEPRPQALASDAGRVVEEQLVSHLLKSNCPVTGQPDWGSVWVDYRGPAIDHGSLLRYIVSFRHHQGFHEQCVERIFLDLLDRCRPERLSVCARYLRRGGLDINPWRSTHEPEAPDWRFPRQ